MSSILKYILVVAALLLSLVIYRYYRVDDTLVNILWTQLIGDKQGLSLPTLPSFVVYNLPEFLWVFAATLLSCDLAWAHKYSVFLYLLPLAVALGIELMQVLGISDGIFDPLDILAALGGYLLAYSISYQSPPSPLPQRLLYALVMSSYCILILADVWI